LTPEDRIAALEGRLAGLENERAKLLDYREKYENAHSELEATHREYEENILRLNQMVVDGELVEIELMQTFNTSADGTWVIDDSFTIHRVNDALLKLLAMEREAVIGQKCYDLLRGSICQTQDCPMPLVKRGKKRLECDMEIGAPNKNGRQAFILTATPFLGLDAKMIGIVESLKDISDRKKAEADLQKANMELQRLAAVDGLTQIANRRSFDQLLRQEWKRMFREKQPLAIILGDIDYFKYYNDTYGHLMGDDCLRTVAQAIEDCLRRPGDLVARYGGEEFAVILPNTDLEGAGHIAQTIRDAVSRLAIPHADSAAADHVTISLGVSAALPAAERDADTFLKTADTALYDAKKQGRNRVVVQHLP
jgi:diguanylate cyclase (GGDEF)-like protein/PAS domain S-box-containing protein